MPFRAKLQPWYCWTLSRKRPEIAGRRPRAGYKRLGSFDSGLQITVEKAEPPTRVFDANDAKQTVALLASLHHGVLAMSPDVAELVQTSTNLAWSPPKAMQSRL